MSALERVARALAAHRYEHGADPQGMDKFQWSEKFWRDYLVEADVAISAMGNHDAIDSVEMARIIGIEESEASL